MPVAKRTMAAQAGASYIAVGSDDTAGHAANSPHRIVRCASKHAEAFSLHAAITNTTWSVANSAAADIAAATSLWRYSATMETMNSPTMSPTLIITVKAAVDIFSPFREIFEVRLFKAATSTGVNSPGVAFRFEKLIYISY